ncbi:MAG: hypothetical protein JSW38_10345 [Dehalococcoidia bacterium]|nr:MAG: hypothetical protein JSW38_10345 [Dehalococcoidia bacterium]
MRKLWSIPTGPRFYYSMAVLMIMPLLVGSTPDALLYSTAETDHVIDPGDDDVSALVIGNFPA